MSKREENAEKGGTPLTNDAKTTRAEYVQKVDEMRRDIQPADDQRKGMIQAHHPLLNTKETRLRILHSDLESCRTMERLAELMEEVNGLLKKNAKPQSQPTSVSVRDDRKTVDEGNRPLDEEEAGIREDYIRRVDGLRHGSAGARKQKLDKLRERLVKCSTAKDLVVLMRNVNGELRRGT